MSKILNEERFFGNIVPNMGNKEKFVEELVENARRANATKIDFTLSEKDSNGCGIFIASNNGDILEDMSSLLIFAESEYSEEVMKRENPAGAGIYIVMSIADKIVFESGNKSLEVSPTKLFKDRKYRENVFSSIKDSEGFVKGMIVTIHLSEYFDFVERVLQEATTTSNLIPEFSYKRNSPLAGYLDIDITYNEKKVEKRKFSPLVKVEGSGILEGMTLMIEEDIFLVDRYHFRPQIGLLYWHGKTIEKNSLFPFTVIVKNNHIFRPVLPDRMDLDNTEEELAEIKAEIEKQLHQKIQDRLDKEEVKPKIRKQSLVDSLSMAYNSDNIEVWDGLERKSCEEEKVRLFQRPDYVKVNFNILESKEKDLEYLIPSFEDAGIMFVSNRRNIKTPMPSWVEEILEDVAPEIFVETSAKNQDLSSLNSTFTYVDKIELGTKNNKSEVVFAAFASDDILISSFDIDFELDALAESVTEGNYEISADEQYEYFERDLSLLRGKIKKEIKVSSIREESMTRLREEGKNLELSSLVYDVDSGIVLLKTKTGEEFSYTASKKY